MSILAGILRFIVTIVITIVATVAPGKTADATAPNAPFADNCKLRIATISDMHMKGGIEGLPNDLVLQLAKRILKRRMKNMMHLYLQVTLRMKVQ